MLIEVICTKEKCDNDGIDFYEKCEYDETSSAVLVRVFYSLMNRFLRADYSDIQMRVDGHVFMYACLDDIRRMDHDGI